MVTARLRRGPRILRPYSYNPPEIVYLGASLAITTKLVTAEELARLPSDFRCELIDGEVVELMPPGGVHGVIAATVARILGTHIAAHRLGVVLVESGFILRRNPDTVRSPDVGFVRADRIPPDGVPRGFWETAPDLVVEVVSPGDTPAEIRAKVRDWIEAGARLVWVVYPDTRTVEVARSLQERFTLTVGDTIDGGELLAGFACPVADLFG